MYDVSPKVHVILMVIVDCFNFYTVYLIFLFISTISVVYC